MKTWNWHKWSLQQHLCRETPKWCSDVQRVVSSSLHPMLHEWRPEVALTIHLSTDVMEVKSEEIEHLFQSQLPIRLKQRHWFCSPQVKGDSHAGHLWRYRELTLAHTLVSNRIGVGFLSRARGIWIFQLRMVNYALLVPSLYERRHMKSGSIPLRAWTLQPKRGDLVIGLVPGIVG